MTPGARVAAAIGVLDAVLDGQPAEQALTGWARGARYAGSGDRAAVRDHVFQALRCRRSYACLGGAETGRGLMFGALRAAGSDPDTLFTGAGHAPPPLDAAERQAGRAPESDGERMDMPDWLVEAFRASLGDGAEAAAQALRQRAPVILRVNERINSVPQVIEKLSQDDIEAEPVTIAPTAVRVTRNARRVARSAAYLDGGVELQDGSSQAAMAALDVPTGARVLDYCAGGGGKVLALAARAEATWYAHDADVGRMKDLPARAARAGVQVHCLAPGQVARHAPYDLVLCDVPCSGSGTWRRAPDAKWRLDPDRLTELTRLQLAILQEAAALVAPGGELAYATCSLLRPENESVIKKFTEETVGWKYFFTARWPVSDEGDGFFLARFGHSG
ncbi:RsmB/NOP family class I SAM-dependent RNA methyltransferase [Roseovarius amoyensis]|uniref:RsmB/NOP family class I SAM-dependent RNA methyltransferase n=1 Tax=Roseovarius amoyensis TaxID=2211448 RepID=UPI000DBE3285|nr:RsmB/NOP family class I SAM-dependent RNA methyltransferase [Roseovarius amoyensis]